MILSRSPIAAGEAVTVRPGESVWIIVTGYGTTVTLCPSRGASDGDRTRDRMRWRL